VDRIHLAYDKNPWWIMANTLANLSVQQSAYQSLAIFSRTLLSAVIYN